MDEKINKKSLKNKLIIPSSFSLSFHINQTELQNTNQQSTKTSKILLQDKTNDKKCQIPKETRLGFNAIEWYLAQKNIKQTPKTTPPSRKVTIKNTNYQVNKDSSTGKIVSFSFFLACLSNQTQYKLIIII